MVMMLQNAINSSLKISRIIPCSISSLVAGLLLTKQLDKQPCNFFVMVYVRKLMEYTSTLTFREEWADQRLAYDDGGQHEFLILPDPNKVWKPDLFFYPEKEGWFHAITTPNVLFRIYGTGRVLYSVRLSMVLSCFMQLHLFPLDYQNCTIDMASYAYTTDDIIFYWKEDNPVQIKESILNLPRFQLDRVITGDCTVKTNTGAYSCLKVELHFLRQLNYFIFQTYVPSIMLVVASWVSFWLDQDAIPARITLGVTTLLTVITSTHGINSKLPPVSYTKAIDVWTGACTFFVFAALIEFALVNFASRRERPPAQPGARGRRALQRQRATSMRRPPPPMAALPNPFLNLPPIQRQPQGQFSLSRPISPMRSQQQQRMYGGTDMDPEAAALLLANTANNMGISVEPPPQIQYDDNNMMLSARETSFHRFPSPGGGGDDMFDFTNSGGAHLRAPPTSNNNNNRANRSFSNNVGSNQLYRASPATAGGMNYFCDRLIGGGGPTQQSTIARHMSRTSLTECGVGGLFPAPPASPGGSSMGGGRGGAFGSNNALNFMQQMPPMNSVAMQRAASIRRSFGPNMAEGNNIAGGGGPQDLSQQHERRGLIGKHFRWPTSTAKKIDFVSRVAFPAAFMIFNCGYWSFYLTRREQFRRQDV